MSKTIPITTFCLWIVAAGVAGAQSIDPDLWIADAGSSVRVLLDRSLFAKSEIPAGVEAVLDRQGGLVVVKLSHIDGLVDGSAHVLDFAANQAYHIRPWHLVASARISPDRTRIATVLSEPVNHGLMIYSLLGGEGRLLANVQAAAGSVAWRDDGHLVYQSWSDDQSSSLPVVVDLSKAEYAASVCFGGTGVVPMVTCCGNTCDSYICGVGNPYPCCTNGGNCTWWAWDRACRFWGIPLPGWGNAHSWIRNAQQDGYSVSDVPVVGSIACDSNNTLSRYGHVCYVLDFNETQIHVSQQACGGGYGDSLVWWNRDIYEGYILNPNPPTAPEITQQPAPAAACPEANASFTVSATGGGLSYQWQKNGVDLDASARYTGVLSFTLTIVGVTAGDQADYRCRVSNSVGNVVSTSAALTLKAPTAITQQPQNAYDVMIGVTVTFTAAGAGAGMVTYQWQRNGTDITNGGRISGATSSTLQIASVESGDAGMYRAVVSADCGSKTTNEAVLSFGPAPIPGDFDEDRDVDIEDFAVFQVCLGGSAEPAGPPPCDEADLDGNGYVDGEDRTRMVNCLSGAYVTGDPACAGM